MPYKYDQRVHLWTYVGPDGTVQGWYNPADPQHSMSVPAPLGQLIAQAEGGDPTAGQMVSSYFDALNADEPHGGYFAGQPGPAPAQGSQGQEGVRMAANQMAVYNQQDRDTLSLANRAQNLAQREQNLAHAWQTTFFGPPPPLQTGTPPATGQQPAPDESVSPDLLLDPDYLNQLNQRQVIAAGGMLDAREQAIAALEQQYREQSDRLKERQTFADTKRALDRAKADYATEEMWASSKAENDKRLTPSGNAWTHDPGALGHIRDLQDAYDQEQAGLDPNQYVAEQRHRVSPTSSDYVLGTWNLHRDQSGNLLDEQGQPVDYTPVMARGGMMPAAPAHLTPRYAGGGDFPFTPPPVTYSVGAGSSGFNYSGSQDTLTGGKGGTATNTGSGGPTLDPGFGSGFGFGADAAGSGNQSQTNTLNSADASGKGWASPAVQAQTELATQLKVQSDRARQDTTNELARIKQDTDTRLAQIGQDLQLYHQSYLQSVAGLEDQARIAAGQGSLQQQGLQATGTATRRQTELNPFASARGEAFAG